MFLFTDIFISPIFVNSIIPLYHFEKHAKCVAIALPHLISMVNQHKY